MWIRKDRQLLDTSLVGSFETIYTLATSDEDLPGTTALSPLTLQLIGRVAIGGDATLDDVVNLSDFNVLAANFGQGDRTWQTGDFNRDGLVNLSDFNILASNFGITGNATFSLADFNYDGNVNLTDFNLLASRFGAVVGSAARNAPPVGDAVENELLA